MYQSLKEKYKLSVLFDFILKQISGVTQVGGVTPTQTFGKQLWNTVYAISMQNARHEY